jgi:hypothetical protein
LARHLGIVDQLLPRIEQSRNGQQAGRHQGQANGQPLTSNHPKPIGKFG